MKLFNLLAAASAAVALSAACGAAHATSAPTGQTIAFAFAFAVDADDWNRQIFTQGEAVPQFAPGGAAIGDAPSHTAAFSEIAMLTTETATAITGADTGPEKGGQAHLQFRFGPLTATGDQTPARSRQETASTENIHDERQAT